jgi:putative nucleotidyltransferase with HDIG domain
VGNVEEILSSVLELQSMPAVFFEALDNIQNPQVNAMKMSNIISKDMALTAQILRLVNSAYYGFPKEISQVNNAIALLGFRAIRNMIMMMAMKPMMLSQSGMLLWEHSIRCAYMAQHIAEKTMDTPAEEIFTIGILHDIGRSLFQIYDPANAAEIDRLGAMGVDPLLVEEDSFGVDHTVVGQAYVEKENLPPIIGDAIRYHHDPFNEKAPSIAKVIYLAEMLSQPNPKDTLVDEEIYKKLGFDIPFEKLPSIREEIFEKTEIIIQVIR